MGAWGQALRRELELSKHPPQNRFNEIELELSKYPFKTRFNETNVNFQNKFQQNN
jgi:hypothetical protein